MKWIKTLIPKSLRLYLLALERAYYASKSPFAGVFQNWRDVYVVGDEFQSDAWADMAEDYAKQMIQANQRFIPPAVSNESALLPLLVSLLDKPPRILDFGGAVGFSYIPTKLGSLKSVAKYVIVEHRKICERGRNLFNDSRLTFSEFIPEDPVDIVIIGASLQCIEDYKQLLQTLTGLKPKWFLFTKLPAGENPTYVTAQVNLPGQRHAHWMFNVHELISLLPDYELVFKGAVAGEVNQDGFEPDYRIGQTCNLLFKLRAFM